MGKCKYCGKSAGLFKKVHVECEAARSNGIKQISELITSFSVDALSLPESTLDSKVASVVSEVKGIAANSLLQEIDRRSAVVSALDDSLSNFLDDGLLDEDEERSFATLYHEFGLSTEDSDFRPVAERAYFATVLRKIDSGAEYEAKVSGDLPFNLQKSEKLIWAFHDVKFFEERTKTSYEGGSRGVSVRLAKGVYYRTGSIKGQKVQTKSIQHIDTGLFGLTDKHLYFHGPSKAFRVRFDKLVSIEPYEDGLGIRKDGVSAKPQLFSGFDGWFVSNVARHFSG